MKGDEKKGTDLFPQASRLFAIPSSLSVSQKPLNRRWRVV
jgi:hypothetical protein